MLWHPLLLSLLALTSAQEDRRKYCGRADKKKFNENLLNLFRAEYGKDIAAEVDYQKILKWKFESLDRNDDNFLQRMEYKPLKRLKKLVKPKKCAKAFIRSCDRDKDTNISREEWSKCLGVSIVSLKSTSVVSLSEYKKRKDEPEANDCLSDRQTVLSEQRSFELYVPECAPDGRYHRVQCYKSTGYCWCVHEDDGKPIPGTSAKDKLPDCDAIPVPARPMKGCPFEKKDQFLLDLAAFFGRNDSYAGIAVHTFTRFDTNGNKFLDKKEWKAFRTVVAAQKGLRRCGKRLPRFCDVNNDRRISMTEWASCLNDNQSSHKRRRGPNPLKTILKDD